jgi:hypothetical protein
MSVSPKRIEMKSARVSWSAHPQVFGVNVIDGTRRDVGHKAAAARTNKGNRLRSSGKRVMGSVKRWLSN